MTSVSPSYCIDCADCPSTNCNDCLSNDNCQKCGLWQYSDCPMIQGRGNDNNPKIILIGEAPGPDEGKQGIPFIGRAGKKLDVMIKEALDNNDVYITNMVKCFPPSSTKNPSKGFRVPKESEIELCKPFLFDELESVKSNPIIMTLGNIALFGLIGKNHGITKEAGIKRIVKIGKSLRNLVPNYHPSFILRNNNYEKEFKRIFDEVYKGVK